MKKKLALGIQSFVKLRQRNLFYIDKTHFIKDWWESEDEVTLITRPRRFGKTLMLDTVNTFFSPDFAGQSELFAGLKVWQDQQFRKLQGTIPVIFISFADVKGINYIETLEIIKSLIVDIYNTFLPKSNLNDFSETEKEQIAAVRQSMKAVTAQTALRHLARYLTRQYKTSPIILLDEYDTPFHAAWAHGYWDELVQFIRVFFNSTFKTNKWLERALITGITRISKESIFSDLNNLKVVSTTTNKYTDCFGFTENEVFSALTEYGLTAKAEVKKWYNGFIFGSQQDIYNPWSILSYLSEKHFAPFWGQTSSNALVGQLIGQAAEDIKQETSALLKGESILTTLDEQIVFSQLYTTPGAIWSFLMAAGYVKPLSFDLANNTYEITLTNYEVYRIFENLISCWFNQNGAYGKQFRQALMHDNLEDMNIFLQKIATSSFSFFDTSGAEPERFYHAFVLGLIVDLKGIYTITS